MSFCKNSIPAITAFLAKLTPKVVDAIQLSIDLTGKIKALETNPTVEKLIEILPGASAAEAWLNTALDILAPIELQALSVAEKIAVWLEGRTTLDTEGSLNKLASVAALIGSVALGEPQHPQSFYDTAVQNHIMGLK